MKITPPEQSPHSLALLRRSAAELLASAVLELFPDTQLIKGESTDLGFYYDFVLDAPDNDQTLSLIEERMRLIVKEERPVRTVDMMRENAFAFFAHHSQMIKLDVLDALDDEVITLFQMGSFHDLCRAPHIKNSKEIGAFKLQKIGRVIVDLPAGGFSALRITGTAFADRESLKKFLHAFEAAKKRDHQLLGKELDLFSTQEKTGNGLWLWHPKGAIIRQILTNLWHHEYRKQQFQEVFTPQTANTPPLHPLIFCSKQRSYRELPIRYAEWSTRDWQGKNSQLCGMFRARSYTTDKAHIFCTPEQVLNELISSLQFIDKTIRIFGFEYRFYLKARGDHCAGTLANWEKGEELILEALKACSFAYTQEKGGKEAFHGPRVEARLIDTLGREWSGPYVRLDVNEPERFGLRYQRPDGEMHIPLLVVRSMFGSLERFVAMLVEHYAGVFPLWLAPEQVRIVPIMEKHIAFAEALQKEFEDHELRVGIEYRNDNLGGKIHCAQQEKIPYTVVVGDKEQGEGTLTVRPWNCKERTHRVPVRDFVQQMLKEIAAKSIVNVDRGE